MSSIILNAHLCAVDTKQRRREVDDVRKAFVLAYCFICLHTRSNFCISTKKHKSVGKGLRRTKSSSKGRHLVRGSPKRGYLADGDL